MIVPGLTVKTNVNKEQVLPVGEKCFVRFFFPFDFVGFLFCIFSSVEVRAQSLWVASWSTSSGEVSGTVSVMVLFERMTWVWFSFSSSSTF